MTSEDMGTPEPTGTPEPMAAPQPTGGGATPLAADSKNWGMIAHLSSLVMLIGIPSLVGPLVVWLVRKDQDAWVGEHAREALNFNISVLIYSIVAGISIFFLVGIILLPAVLIAWLVLTIIAGIKASNGETYQYPFTIRLVN